MLQTKKNCYLEKMSTCEKYFSADINGLKNQGKMKQAKIIQDGLKNSDKIELDQYKWLALYQKKFFPCWCN